MHQIRNDYCLNKPSIHSTENINEYDGIEFAAISRNIFLARLHLIFI